MTGISAFYGLGYLDIMAMPVGLRRRYFLDIPRHQAQRNLELAGVVLLPHAGDAGRAAMDRWQELAGGVLAARGRTRAGIDKLRRVVGKYARAIKVHRPGAWEQDDG